MDGQTVLTGIVKVTPSEVVMSGLWDRVKQTPSGAVIGIREAPISAIITRFEQGELPAAVSREASLEALDLLAALAVTALGWKGREAPPLVQASPGNPKLHHALTEEAWRELFPRASRQARLALAAGLLQIHDFWEDSHHAAQEADDLGERPFSAYWHAIAHRREPDAGNAAYWFRRVGGHPIHAELLRHVRALLDAHGDAKLQVQLIRSGDWNSFGFIDFTVSVKPGSPAEMLARELQRLEMLLLLDATAAGL